MRCQILSLAVAIAASVAISNSQAEQPVVAAEAIRSAISHSIPQLEKGAAGSAENRQCFTCHNQALPLLALSEAQRRGFAIDEDKLKAQIKHTLDHLQRGRHQYLEGRGQGGKVLTAGYALWALEDSGWEPDETTAAVTHFLLKYQSEKQYWSHPGNRPPSSGSDFTTSYVALRGLAAFGTGEQRPEIDARTKQVGQWLLGQSPRDTEDRVFRLRALKYVDAPDDVLRAAITELIDTQRSDGGWSQMADMESDAYATATVLVALLRAGGVGVDDPVVRRVVAYLVDAQLEDGTWHVVSRAKPFQTYFESGFPHGKDQFISIAASSWATLALLLALPEPEPELSNLEGTIETARYLRPVGSEYRDATEVKLQQTGGGLVITSVTQQGPTKLTLTSQFDADERLRTARVTVQSDGQPQSAEASHENGTARVTRADGRLDRRECPPHVIVTSAPDWTDAFLLMQRYDAAKGDEQEFPGLWIHPTREPLNLTFKVERVGEDVVEIDGGRRQLDRFSIVLRGGSRYIGWRNGQQQLVRLVAGQDERPAIVLAGWEKATEGLLPRLK